MSKETLEERVRFRELNAARTYIEEFTWGAYTDPEVALRAIALLVLEMVEGRDYE
jgi:hypothetical protein